MVTLGDVLADPEKYRPSGRLYLSFDEKWTLTSNVLILSASDIDGVPQEARESGMEYVIGIDAVQDLVANAKAQKANPLLSELLEAFLFYYDNDAFITFSDE